MMQMETQSHQNRHPEVKQAECRHQSVSTVGGVVTQRFCRIARGKPLAGHVLDKVSVEICASCPLYNTVSKTAGTRVTAMRLMGPISVPDLHGIVTKPQVLTTGEVVYQQVTWEPPPLIPGYRRKSNNPKHKDAWTLVPDVEKCVYSKLESKIAPNCKCERFVLSCTHEQHPGLISSYEQCLTCPHKTFRVDK